MNIEDRQEVLGYLAVIDQNVHNTIENVNKQNIINGSLNRFLEHLKLAVEMIQRKSNCISMIKALGNNFLNNIT